MIQTTFNKTFDRVFGHEAGYQDDPKDPGNWTAGYVGGGTLKGTKYGISAASYPHLEIKNLTLEHARSIYWADWWVALRMDKFRPAIAYQMFDAAFNHGMSNATKILQRAVGVKDDGHIGPVTIGKVKAAELNDVLLRFLAHRLYFMTDIKNFTHYGRGWSRRVAKNLLFASSDN